MTFDAIPPGDNADGSDRPADAFEAAWPFNADSAQVEGLLRSDRFMSIMLVDVTGLHWDQIATYLDTVRETARTKEMVPVFIVDLIDYRPLIAENLAYDTLPNAALNAPLSPELDWPSYLAWRRTLLRDKWHPAAIITLGPHAEWEAP